MTSVFALLSRIGVMRGRRPADPPDQTHQADDAAARAAIAKEDADSLQLMHTNFYSLAAGTLERAKFAAQLVQTGSAAIATLYSGILALVFSASDKPLPVQGIVTPLFLGAAVVMSTAYISYISPSRDAGAEIPLAATNELLAYQRLFTFMRYASSLASRRVPMLRGSVIALGVGLAAITLPFLEVPNFAGTNALPTNPAAAAPAIPSWPAPVTARPSEQAAELYKAQVAEALEARKQAASKAASGGDSFPYLVIWVAAGTVLVVIGAVGPEWKHRYRARRTNGLPGTAGRDEVNGPTV